MALKRLPLWRRGRDEQGATAIVVTFLALALFAAAALAVDYSNLVMERQKLHDHIDSAAHAGAFELPAKGSTASQVAYQMAVDQDSDIAPDTALYCVVASTGEDRLVRADQIPATCNPGSAPYTESKYPGLRCNTVICAIPCRASTSTLCNTIEVTEDKNVPFGFGRILGINSGQTGAISSAACKGSCGQEMPNPLDVVVMADRTASMENANRNLMASAIQSTLTTMDPTMHYVSLGTLHKSIGSKTGACPTEPRANASGREGSSAILSMAREGRFMATDFSRNYLTTSGTPNYADPVVKGLECMKGVSGNPSKGMSGSYYGTWLASAMKAGARQLLYPSESNLASMPARVGGTPKKVLIFETDGRPFEINKEGTTSLSSAGDITAGRQNDSRENGQNGCKNMIEVARQAKERGVTVITIGFGDATSANCSDSGTSGIYTRDALASAASPTAAGVASKASKCSTATEIEAENTDGDFYFCAVNGGELADIFKTAISQVSNGIRLIKMP